MTFTEFSSDIKRSLKQYATSGLIDDLQIYDYAIEGLNFFNILPTIRIETMLEVKNNKVKLPDGFKSIYYAAKCDPYKYTVDDDKGKHLLQDIHFYKVREIKNQDWNFCEPCEIEESETCVVEKTYLYNNTYNFYYNNFTPVKLKITPHVKKTMCDRECKNFGIQDSPYEVSINNKTLYTNFKSGRIYLVYNGYEEDEEGFLLIPDTTEGNLVTYLKAHVKRRIIEDLLANSDNSTNEQFLYTLYDREAREYYPKAMGEIKLNKVLSNIDNYRKKLNSEFLMFDKGRHIRNF